MPRSQRSSRRKDLNAGMSIHIIRYTFLIPLEKRECKRSSLWPLLAILSYSSVTVQFIGSLWLDQANYRYSQAPHLILRTPPTVLYPNLHTTLSLISLFHHLSLPSCPQSDPEAPTHSIHSWPFPRSLQTPSFI